MLDFPLMRDAPERARAVAPKHAWHWRELQLPGDLRGPVVDRSAGLLTVAAGSADAAALVANDLFLEEHMLQRQWVRVRGWLLDWIGVAPPHRQQQEEMLQGRARRSRPVVVWTHRRSPMPISFDLHSDSSLDHR